MNYIKFLIDNLKSLTLEEKLIILFFLGLSLMTSYCLFPISKIFGIIGFVILIVSMYLSYKQNK